ncbi:metallophosphoesterase family protein [Mucilaginibacter sp. AW1-3]
MTVSITICRFVFWMGIACCPYLVFAQQKSTVIAFTADTQAPLLIEEVIRKTDHNEKATAMIFKDVVTLRPASLFILGDVVSLSFENSKWTKMDTYLKLCAVNNIPVYAVLGNHELMLEPDKGKRNFQSRFPVHVATGYTEIIDSVAVILLNSNFSGMTADEIIKQDNWYNNTIKQMDRDSAIKLIIVGCHHPPFTNSKVVEPAALVQQKFVPAFITSKKSVLFLSGHSHNFEQFNVQGKYFLVIGGGGGPHQPLYTDKQRSRDMAPAYKPMFHYLEVKRYQDTLQVISRQLKADFSGFSGGLKFNIKP